jgi:hypothetical protein
MHHAKSAASSRDAGCSRFITNAAGRESTPRDCFRP